MAVGCGGGGEDGATGKALERELAALVAREQQVEPTGVTCPAGPFRKGDTPTCTATVGQARLEYVVTFMTDARFEAKPRTSTISKADLEARLAEQQKAVTTLDVSVSCGDQAVYDTASLAGAACRASAGALTYPIRVTVEGAEFTSKPASPLAFKARLEPFGASYLVTQGVSGATVDCGAEPVRVVDAGSPVRCTTTAADGTRTVEVKLDDDGRPVIASVSLPE